MITCDTISKPTFAKYLIFYRKSLQDSTSIYFIIAIALSPWRVYEYQRPEKKIFFFAIEQWSSDSKYENKQLEKSADTIIVFSIFGEKKAFLCPFNRFSAQNIVRKSQRKRTIFQYHYCYGWQTISLKFTRPEFWVIITVFVKK